MARPTLQLHCDHGKGVFGLSVEQDRREFRSIDEAVAYAVDHFPMETPVDVFDGGGRLVMTTRLSAL